MSQGRGRFENTGGGRSINVVDIICSPVRVIGLTDRPQSGGGGGHVTHESDRSECVHASAYTPQ